MSGDYLLDTNAAIALIEREPAATELVAENRLYLNPSVVGELRFGAEKSERTRSNHERIDELARTCPVLPITESTAVIYGRLRNELRKKGTPIPNNDVWIAATALEYRLPLLTRDSHFAEVVSLERIGW